MYKFKFADIGEGLHEGAVGEIYVKNNQDIKEGDPLFSVETDKVNSDIPSPVSGKIHKILIKKGQTIHVGEEIFHIDNGKNNEILEEKQDKEEANEEDTASVVGSIEVSNELFSFDSFNNNQSQDNENTIEKNISQSEKKCSKDIVDGINLPNPSEITPKGNGISVDVVVIGAGPGGYDVAERLSKEGLKVVVIEDRFAGGVCLNIGCIPTKALLKCAKVYSYMKHGNNLGLEFELEKVKINWLKMQERKNKISKNLEKGVEFRLKAAKSTFIKSKAEIIDKHNVKANDKVYTTKYIIVASGSRPITLNKLNGFDEGVKNNIVIDSTGALELKKLPKKLGIIGGGVIGVEFATLFNELGVQVTILEGLETILGPMDHDVQKFTTNLLKEKNINVLTGVQVKELDGNKVIYEVNGKEESIEVDKLLCSVGRLPNNLNLDKKLGIKLGKKGEIIVNDIMQTNIANIFAIGDVVGHSMLAHTAYRHAAVVHSAFKGVLKPYRRDTIPGCIYIYPEISVIGKTEQELKDDNIEYGVSIWQNKNIGRALAEDDTKGFTKLLYDKKYGLILGAHIINHASSEIITEIGALMEMEGTIFEISDTTHPHPALCEGIYEAAVHARSHLENK